MHNKRVHREGVDYDKRYYDDKENIGYGGPSISSHLLRRQSTIVKISDTVTPLKRRRIVENIQHSLHDNKKMDADVKFTTIDIESLPLFVKQNPDDATLHIAANGIQYVNTQDGKSRPYLVYVPINLKDPYLVRNVIQLCFDERMSTESPSKVKPNPSQALHERKEVSVPAKSARPAPRVNRKPFGTNAYTIQRLENGYGALLNALIEENTEILINLLEKDIINHLKYIKLLPDGKIRFNSENIDKNSLLVIHKILNNPTVKENILCNGLKKDLTEMVILKPYEVWLAILMAIERPHLGHKFDHAITGDDSTENTYIQKMRLNGCQTSLGSLILRLNKEGYDLKGEHVMTFKPSKSTPKRPSHLAKGKVDISYTTKSGITIGQQTRPSVFFLPVNGVMNQVTKAMTDPYLEEIGTPSKHNNI